MSIRSLIDPALEFNKAAEENLKTAGSVVGSTVMTGLEAVNQANIAVNKFVTPRRALGVAGKAIDALPGDQSGFLDTSYHDVRQRVIDYARERHGEGWGIAADVLAPDAIDFVGGIGYWDNIAKGVGKVRKFAPEIGKGARHLTEILDDALTPNFLKLQVATVGGGVLDPSNVRKIIGTDDALAATAMKHATDVRRGTLATRASKHSGLGTGSKGRAKKKDVTGPGSPATHITQGEYWDGRTSLTNVHHVGGLEDQGRAAVAHSSYVDGQRSPVVMYAEKHYGVRGGNWKENLADILENKTNISRQERVKQIHKQLDGSVHPKTIDDLLGTSDLKIREYTPKQLDARREFKRQYPNVDYPKELKFGNIKNPDLFPEIKIRDSNNKVVDTWQAKNIDEYERRWEIVTEKYYGGKKSINRKAIKTDPKLDIYSSDHSHTHNLIREARRTEGNPLYVLETAIENGTYQNMPVGQAAKLYADAHKYQESIASAVLQRRYTHIQELWLEIYPKGNGRGAFKFDHLGKPAKKRFFKEYAHKIGSRGGVHEKGVKASEVLLDAKEGWTPGMTDVFGWNPTAKIKDPIIKNRIKQAQKLSIK